VILIIEYPLVIKKKGEKPPPEIFKAMVDKIDQGQFDELFAFDQLATEMKEGNVFVGFQEGKMNFRPTFKVERDKEFAYVDERSPAWCDRILWRSFPGYEIEQKNLGCAPLILTSDHKPVYSSFTVNPFVVPSARNEVLGELEISLKALKGHNLPKADMGGSSDPYIVFAAPFLAIEVQTTVIKKNVNPEWEDGEVPVLKSLWNSKERLMKSFIMIKIMDKDKISIDDTIALGVLHLAEYTNGKPVPFTVNLTCGGMPAGTLTGHIAMTWGKSTFEPLPREVAVKRHDQK